MSFRRAPVLGRVVHRYFFAFLGSFSFSRRHFPTNVRNVRISKRLSTISIMFISFAVEFVHSLVFLQFGGARPFTRAGPSLAKNF